jgi:hypothetical protein
MCREKEGKINVSAPGGVKGYSGKLTPITLNIPWSIFGNGNKIRQSQAGPAFFAIGFEQKGETSSSLPFEKQVTAVI